jgi:hypothetical protein
MTFGLQELLFDIVLWHLGRECAIVGVREKALKGRREPRVTCAISCASLQYECDNDMQCATAATFRRAHAVRSH